MDFLKKIKGKIKQNNRISWAIESCCGKSISHSLPFPLDFTFFNRLQSKTWLSLNFSSLFSIGLLRGNHKLAGHGPACLSAPFIWLIEASCGRTLSHQALLLHFTDPQHNQILSGIKINWTKAIKKIVHENMVQLCYIQLNFGLNFYYYYYYFLSNCNGSVFTHSFVLASRRPV